MRATRSIAGDRQHPVPSHPSGRPRSAAADEAILRAVLELLSERGVEGTTMSTVIERSGVSRATVYLRWPNRNALIAAAVRRAMGRQPYALTGDFETDIRTGVEEVRKMFSRPAFLEIFPELARGLLEDRGKPDGLTYDVMAPNRLRLAAEYREVAERVGLRTDVDAEWVIDLLIGAFINRVLATGKVPTAALGKQAVDIVLNGVRTQPAEPRRGPRAAGRSTDRSRRPQTG